MMTVDEAKEQGLIPLIESIPFSLESSEWELLESKNGDIVSGVSVLGYVRGPFFIVEGASQNNRWYSRKLWEKVINENHDAHEQGSVIGTIGHDLELDDKALREGKGSHRITRLWIPNNEAKSQAMGHGEAAILDTTTGRELYGYLKGGVNLAVSSRAFGKFEGKKSGYDVVEASTYKYEGFDFVRKGGVMGAIPSLVTEEKAKVIAPSVDYVSQTVEPLKPKQEVMEDYRMSDDVKSILEKVTEEKAKLQTQLDTVLANNEDLKGKLAITDNRLSEVDGMLTEYKGLGTVTTIQKALADVTSLEEKQSSIVTELKETKTKLGEAQVALKAFDELGTADEIDMALDVSKDMAESLKGVGTIEEFKSLKDSVATYENLGTIEELKKVLEYLQNYSELGTIEEIQEAFEKTKNYVETINEMGSIDDISTIMDKLEEYLKLGTPEEIGEAFDMTEKIVEGMKAEKFEADVKEVQNMLKIKDTTARTLLEKLGSKEAALEMTNTIRQVCHRQVCHRQVCHRQVCHRQVIY